MKPKFIQTQRFSLREKKYCINVLETWTVGCQCGILYNTTAKCLHLLRHTCFLFEYQHCLLLAVWAGHSDWVLEGTWEPVGYWGAQWWGNVNHPPGKATCPGVVGQQTTNSMVFLWSFCFVLLSLVLIGLLSISFDFFVGFLVHFLFLIFKHIWVGSKVGKICER